MTTTTTLNLTDTEKRTRKDGSKRETWYGVTCGACGCKNYLRMHDARKAVSENRICGTCQRLKNYEKVKSLYGVDFLVEKTIERQLNNPSKPEKQIMLWLDEMGVQYLRQQIAKLGTGRYVVDFLLADGRAIESSGGWWHAQNKQAKDEELAGVITVLFLTDELTMKNPTLAREIIAKFACQEGVV